MCSASPGKYTGSERRALRKLARRSIVHGLNSGQAVGVRLGDYPEHLREHLACFVTLHHQGELRGCIGHLEATRPLVSEIAQDAYAAAFQDPRFPPLVYRELEHLDIEISVLGQPQAMEFRDQQDLLQQLHPGVDGLILRSPDGRQGTFLPSVWDSLSEPAEFLAQLKRKAGLATDYWAPGIQVARYTTESF